MVIRANLNPQKKIQVTKFSVSAQNIDIKELKGVDVSNLEDGSVLVYEQSSDAFVATRTLQKQIINGGQF